MRRETRHTRVARPSAFKTWLWTRRSPSSSVLSVPSSCACTWLPCTRTVSSSPLLLWRLVTFCGNVLWGLCRHQWVVHCVTRAWTMRRHSSTVRVGARSSSRSSFVGAGGPCCDGRLVRLRTPLHPSTTHGHSLHQQGREWTGTVGGDPKTVQAFSVTGGDPKTVHAS